MMATENYLYVVTSQGVTVDICTSWQAANGLAEPLRQRHGHLSVMVNRVPDRKTVEQKVGGAK